ncbi:MAG: hypothetical protein QM504_14265 [Pseudomonadota bacterium]
MVDIIVDESSIAEALPRLLIRSEIQFKYELLGEETHCFKIAQNDYETVNEHVNVINDWGSDGEIRDMLGMNSMEMLVMNDANMVICKKINETYITRAGESITF